MEESCRCLCGLSVPSVPYFMGLFMSLATPEGAQVSSEQGCYLGAALRG